jgi:hypothetical protein
MNRSASVDFESAFSKLQSIQYRYELVHDAMLSLKSNNRFLDGLEYLNNRYPQFQSGDDRLRICKAQFMMMLHWAEDMLDRVKQVANLTSTLVSYKQSQAMVCNTASLDRMAHASKKDGDMLLYLTKATQKDSSTVRLISMITMVYLPGAFVASFFSTSFINAALNYTSTSKSPTKHQIMVHACSFIAVTAGLMLITFLGAFHWNRKMSKQAEGNMTVL